MASAKQIEANRRNSLKSTGPNTEAGKRASSLNAYRHGLTGQLFLMTPAEAEAHERYMTLMLQDLKPVGAMEETLARSIADSHWRLNRAVIIENNIFAAEAFDDETIAARDAASRGVESRFNDVNRCRSAVTSFLHDPRRFQLLTIYEARIHRKAQADLRQLRELQAARRLAEDTPVRPATQPQPPAVVAQTTDLEDLNPPNGFVCSPARMTEIADPEPAHAAPAAFLPDSQQTPPPSHVPAHAG